MVKHPQTTEPAAKPRGEMICFRADAETKRRIEAAARRSGQSTTTFLLEAAIKAVQRTETKPPAAPKQHGGVPTYFRALCAEAARGGEFGYRSPGYELARHLSDQQPYDADADEWGAELQRLSDLLLPRNPATPPGPGRIAYHLRDDAAVWRWFEEHYPKWAALVPPRRRKQFVAGVYECCDNGDIGL
jgi:hypothetical protein